MRIRKPACAQQGLEKGFQVGAAFSGDWGPLALAPAQPLSGLGVTGNEQWQPQSQTGQVSGCGVEPVFTWELKPLPDPTDGTGE